MSRSVAVIIPARFDSTRFPGKPLKILGQKPVIEHVVENALAVASVSRVIVATDDQRIASAVERFSGSGLEVAMTGFFASGTDRVAHVASSLTDDIIVNLQGDEPFLTAKEIDVAVNLVADKGYEIGTLASSISTSEDYENRNIVKVLFDKNGKALYFSRFPIPYSRKKAESPFVGFRHIGLYVYKRKILLELASLPQGEMEKAESLEQLRFMEAGHSIGVAKVDWQGIGIDTEEDLLRAGEYLKRVINGRFT